MASSTLVITIARLFNLIIMARLLTPADFGMVAVALAIISICQLVLQLGMAPALIQKPSLSAEDTSTALTAGICLSLLGCVVIVVTTPVFVSLTQQDALRTLLPGLAVSFVIHALTAPTEAILQRALEFRLLARADVIAYLLGYFGVSVACALLGFGAWSLVAAFVAEKACRLGVLTLAHGLEGRPGFSLTSFRTLLRFGIGYTLAATSNVAANRGDKLAIARYVDAGIVGEYDRAYQLMVLPANIMQSIVSRVLYPALARVRDSKTALRVNLKRGLLLTSLLIMPLSGLCVALAPELVRILLGSQWQESVEVFRIFCSVMLFRCTYKISDELAQACGAVYQRAWRQAFYALSTIGGAIIGIRWGVTGAAIGVALSIVCNFFLMTSLSLRLTEAGWIDIIQAHLPGLLCTVTTVTIATWCASLMRADALHGFIIVVVTSTASALTWLLTIRLIPNFMAPEKEWLLALYKGMASRSLHQRKAL